MRVKKVALMILVAVASVFMMMQVSVFADTEEVESIEFEPIEPYEFFENDTAHGKFEGEGSDDQYFSYYVPGFIEGDVLTVTTTNGTKQYEFTSLDSGEYGFVNGNDIIKQDEITTENDQSVTHYERGKENYYTISYKGKTFGIPVVIKENPVKSISFESGGNAELIENDFEHGYFDIDSKGNEFFCYYPYFSKGDTLIIDTKDGSKQYDYQYLENEGEFFVNGDDKISKNDILINHDQTENHWEKGKDNRYTISYLGSSCDISAPIVESPIDAISYIPVKPYEYVDGDTKYGYVEDEGSINEHFHYEIYSEPGDKLIVTKNGIETEYIYQFYGDSTYYINGDDRIPSSMILDMANQADWGVGKKNYIRFAYKGRTYDVPVVIRENNVKEICFEPKTPYEFVENDESHGNIWEEYGIFNYNIPNYREGDKLIVTSKEGKDTEYQYSNEGYFYNDKEKIDSDDMVLLDNQRKNPWVVGGENYYTISYLGHSYNVPVSIVSSPVAKIEYVPVKPYEFYINDIAKGELRTDEDGNEYFYYYVSHGFDGDKLVVTENDGTKKEYEYKYISDEGWYFVNDKERLKVDEDIRFHEEQNQKQNHWTASSENSVTVSYLGKTCTIPVKVIESPIESIEYKPAKPYEYVENDESNGFYTDDGNHFIYFLQSIADDDMMTVKTKTETKEYINQYVEYLGRSVFVNTRNEKDIIEPGDIAFFSDQNVTPWKVGMDNYFTISYKGKQFKLSVTVISEEQADERRKEVQKAIGRIEELINKVNALNADDYTEESYQRVMEAITASNDVITQMNPSPDDIYAAAKTIENAIDSLEKKEQDDIAEKEAPKTSANEAIENAKALKEADYTEESYKAVADAKTALEQVLADEKSTSQDITTATKALNDAIISLKTKKQAEKEEAEKKEAEAVVEAKKEAEKATADADSIKADDYTEESYKAVANAKANLAKVLAKPNATSAEINEAVKALNDAIAALQKKDEGSSEETRPSEEDIKPSEPSDEDKDAIAIAVGSNVTVSGSMYKVTSTTTVALKKAKNSKSFKVPASVKLADGKTYKVTQLNAKSFTGKKIKTVTIGKNVKKIQKNAFKSSKASKLIVKTKLLKKASVKGSLKGSKVKKVQVKIGSKKVNKKYVKKYKKIFTKKNAGKKVSVK